MFLVQRLSLRANFTVNILSALLLVVFLSISVRAQQIQIVLGPDEIGQNQPWTITVTVQNDRLKSYDNFPDIEGFSKGGQSTSSQTNIINGQISSSQSVTMNYFPQRQGTIVIPAFKMKINEQVISSGGKKVTVGPPVQNRQRDPFRSYFERDDSFGTAPTEYIDIKEDAFLAVSTNKEEVYVGEGFNTVLGFYVAEENKAPLYWYQLSKQVTEILKKIKPSNCWEENFNIENIEGERISIQGKMYTRYKIYQATFYPLNAEPVVFPSVSLEMIKYKVAKNPSFFGQNRQEDFKTFYSKPKSIMVKELPPHPLSKQVAVGDYRLDERISSTALQTGKSFSYDFSIVGEGNISSISKPIARNTANFDFYEPNVRQNINRQGNRVVGSKTFSYFIIPKEPGKFKLADELQWIYFSPSKKKYDTLKAKSVVMVTGESLKNEVIESSDPGLFYDQIASTDNTLRAEADNRWLKYSVNILVLVMLAGSVYLVFKK
jgi:hypothetical protein